MILPAQRALEYTLRLIVALCSLPLFQNDTPYAMKRRDALPQEKGHRISDRLPRNRWINIIDAIQLFIVKRQRFAGSPWDVSTANFGTCSKGEVTNFVTANRRGQPWHRSLNSIADTFPGDGAVSDN